MKSFLTATLIILSPLLVIAQTTFGKIIDLVESPLEIGGTIFFYEDHLFVISLNNCESNNVISGCSGISKFTTEGDLVSTNTFKLYEPRLGSTEIVSGDSILFLTCIETSALDEISLSKSSLTLFSEETLSLSLDNNKRYSPQGIQKFNDTYIIHGVYDDLTPGERIKGFVKRYNQDFTEELDNWTFGENEILSINDLRVAPDNNLIFSFFEQKVGPNGPEYPVRINKIDNSGQMVGEYKVEDGKISAGSRMNLDLNDQGEVYFNYDEGFSHRIAKLDERLDSLIWNIILPSDYYPKDRNYSVNELIVTSNGDVVLTGTVDYIHQNEGRVNSAFVARIDSFNGEIKWLKILTNEIIVPHPFDEKYIHTYLYDIIELPNGTLYGVGQVTQRTYDIVVLHEIFLLSISEDGCIEGFDCNDDIYVTNSGESFPLFTSTSNLKDIENKIIFPNPVQDKLYLETTDHNWNYKIINLQGQQMMNGVYQDGVDVAQLPSGIYFLQLQREGDYFKAIKFVKK